MINNSELQSIKNRFGIIGNSPTLNYALRVAVQVAKTDMTVIIIGESGTGKESFSKIIHQLSPRKHGQFIAVNCGAIPEGTIDSELFGHEKGSFTGAHEARKGYFEVTNKGSIFLDEIGEMPLGTQSRLLRVLESGEFIRVGSSKVQNTDVRVIAATNVNLIKAVENGDFREDLYYRFNTPIYVPPLRDRGDDIELLFRKFASDFSEKYRMEPLKLSDEARTALMKYRFPGNIRQLKNIVEQMSVLEMERTITLETLLKYLPQENNYIPAVYSGNKKESDGISERDLLYKVLFDMKRDMNDMKKVVHQILKRENYGEVLKDKQDLFHDIDDIPTQKEAVENPQYLLSSREESEPQNYEEPAIEDITHEAAEDENLSLEKKEKELIIKALRKNNNKRKYAAQDLGISERTLYRKIKQYHIED